MSRTQSSIMSMEPYGLNFSINVELGVLASMIQMIGIHVDQGPGTVAHFRESVLNKLLVANTALDTYSELREEKDFFKGFFLTTCALLLALDAYLAITPMNPGSLWLYQDSAVFSDTNSNQPINKSH